MMVLNKLGLKKLLVLAILLRLLLMPFYFHPDIKTYNYQSSFLKKGVLNIYSYLVNNKDQLPLKEEFVYFPLTYFFLGGYQILASAILGSGFDHWLADASSLNLQSSGVFRYLFMLKLPYLVVDLLIAYLVMEFFDNDKQKRKAFLIWLFNPFSIVLIYIYSNIDVLPVAISLLGLLYLKRKKIFLSALLLGLASGFKAYPLLLLPFILLSVKGLREKVIYAAVSIGSFILVISPFISSAAFRQSTLVSGLTTRIIFPGLSIGFGETLMFSMIIMSAFYLVTSLRSYEGRPGVISLSLGLLLILFSSIHFHIQWLLWAIPFWVILIAEDDSLFWPFIFLNSLSFLIPLLYEDKAMSVGLLPAISNLYNLLPSPFGIVQKGFDPYSLQSVMHSILAGFSLVIVWNLIKKKTA